MVENIKAESILKNVKPQCLRALMVEDVEDDALLTFRELKRNGFDPVYERVDTAPAMKKALLEKQWDIILCDYKMPHFSAPAAIALLKEMKLDIPIIIVSGNIGEETAIECMRLGAQDYIMKTNLSRPLSRHHPGTGGGKHERQKEAGGSIIIPATGQISEHSGKYRGWLLRGGYCRQFYLF